MKNILAINIILFVAMTLFGCGDSSTENDASQSNNSGTTSGTSSEENQTIGGHDGHLDNLVRSSDLIIHGTATNMTSKMSIEGIPYIFTTFQIHEVVAGEYAGGNSITVKHVGGEYPNGNVLSATNSPSIETGQESIFMVQKHTDTGCDFVKCQNGYFVIEQNQVIAANESAIVVNGRNEVEYISLSGRKSGKHKNSLQDMNVSKFISHLKNLDQKSIGLHKGRKSPISDTNMYAEFHAYKGLTKAGRAATPPKLSANKSQQNEGSNYDRWEKQALIESGGNPVLNQYYSGE